MNFLMIPGISYNVLIPLIFAFAPLINGVIFYLSVIFYCYLLFKILGQKVVFMIIFSLLYYIFLLLDEDQIDTCVNCCFINYGIATGFIIGMFISLIKMNEFVILVTVFLGGFIIVGILVGIMFLLSQLSKKILNKCKIIGLLLGIIGWIYILVELLTLHKKGLFDIDKLLG